MSGAGALDMRPVIGVIGDVAVDVLLAISGFPRRGEDAFAEEATTCIGGCGANVSIALGRLGVIPRLFSAVGDDIWGRYSLSSLMGHGVDTQKVAVECESPTHLTIVIVTTDGERTILGHRGASSRLHSEMIDRNDCESLAMLVISGYSLLTDPQRSTTVHAVRLAAEANVPVVLDLPAGLSTLVAGPLAEVLPQVDWLIVSEEDTRLLGRSDDVRVAMSALVEQVDRLVVKSGAGGCLYGSSGEARRVFAPAVAVRDTTGAGDAFLAGLAAALVSGLDVSSALEVGVALGAAATLRFGTGRCLPEVSDAVALIRQNEISAAKNAENWLRSLV